MEDIKYNDKHMKPDHQNVQDAKSSNDQADPPRVQRVDMPTQTQPTPRFTPGYLHSFGCSAGIIPYDLSATEKEEVREFIRAVHPRSENSTIVLDSSDLPEDVKGLVSVVCRDKDVTQFESRSLLSRAREYKVSQSQNPGGQNVP